MTDQTSFCVLIDYRYNSSPQTLTRWVGVRVRIRVRVRVGVRAEVVRVRILGRGSG